MRDFEWESLNANFLESTSIWFDNLTAWTSRWDFKLKINPNRRPQISHSNFFSCGLKFANCHSNTIKNWLTIWLCWMTKGLDGSRVQTAWCFRWWVFRPVFDLKLWFGQISQRNGSSPWKTRLSVRTAPRMLWSSGRTNSLPYAHAHVLPYVNSHKSFYHSIYIEKGLHSMEWNERLGVLGWSSKFEVRAKAL